eukprot:TRINITY_DN5662_c0_g3_i1.p1 TRINITY_DN5662_c0_g3~~TRINITY_DN5662_c0_g3_i1.p1  ORF type:complete len:180 (-),score=28.92 TRINITY_DN5662_c0_g3_i1:50-589(-)
MNEPEKTEAELRTTFIHSANLLTQLYKQGLGAQRNSYAQGYRKCLEDLSLCIAKSKMNKTNLEESLAAFVEIQIQQLNSQNQNQTQNENSKNNFVNNVNTNHHQPSSQPNTNKTVGSSDVNKTVVVNERTEKKRPFESIFGTFETQFHDLSASGNSGSTSEMEFIFCNSFKKNCTSLSK